MRMNRIATVVTAERLKLFAAMIFDWLKASIVPMIATSAVSFCRLMQLFISGGTIPRSACGITT